MRLGPFTHEFDINHRIGGNQTALMIAATNGKFDAVNMLINNGADWRLLDADGYTAADLAAGAGHPVVSSLLYLRDSKDWAQIRSMDQR